MNSQDGLVGEERTIYGFVIIVLSPVVIAVIASAASFGGSASVCAAGIVLAATGLVRTRRRLPRACVYRSRLRAIP